MFPDFEIILTTTTAGGIQKVMHLLIVDLHVTTKKKVSEILTHT